MIYKWFLPGFIICLCFTLSHAQKNPRYQEAKLYAKYRPRYANLDNDFRITPAFRIQGNRKHFHEFGINRVNRSRTRNKYISNYRVYYSENTQAILALFYQLGYTWYQRQQLAAYVAGSVTMEGSSNVNDPQRTTSFKRRAEAYDASFGVVPGARFAFSEHLVADMNAVFNVYSYGWRFQRIYNPHIPVRQQKNLNIEQTWIPIAYFHLRVGVAYRW